MSKDTKVSFVQLYFYSFAIPHYIIYRYHLWIDSSDHLWDQLHFETSQKALNTIYGLEGFYIKCGQLIASNVGNGFPKVWQDTMSILQDKCPPKYYSFIEEIIKRELDFEAIFDSIDPEPIGSASIGQVHRARLKNGQTVVVKVCYPNVEKLLRGDVRTVKAFAKVAQPVYVPVIEEIEVQFQTEFDYRKEGQNLENIRKNLINAGLAGSGKPCVLPKPYLEYCTKHVLVMEELIGDKLGVELCKEIEKFAYLSHQTVAEFTEQERRNDEECKRLRREYMGPSVHEYERMIRYLSYQQQIRHKFVLAHNWTIGFLKPTSDESFKSRMKFR